MLPIFRLVEKKSFCNLKTFFSGVITVFLQYQYKFVFSFINLKSILVSLIFLTIDFFSSGLMVEL